MAKIGRNDPCSCGSGKKYKKCCGATALIVPSPHDQQTRLSASIPIGLPGHQMGTTFRARFVDPNDPRNTGGVEGLPGKYKVTFTLSRPGIPLLPEYERNHASLLQGDSHIAITQPAISDPNVDIAYMLFEVDMGGTLIQFKGLPNDKGFLGKLELEEIDADDFNDATLKSFRVVLPTLSHTSVFLDTPLHIQQVDVTEIRTESVRVTSTAPFRQLPLAVAPQVQINSEFQVYASFYREALNSNSPLYQFLCYFKIIEGLRGRRSRLVTEAKIRGEVIAPRPREIVPPVSEEQIKWLNSIFPLRKDWDGKTLGRIFPKETEGKKINDVIDKKLNPLRVKIAHAFLDSGEVLSVDEIIHIEIVNLWLPLTKCIARFLLKSEFPDEFLTT